jgi:hypothetical protein
MQREIWRFTVVIWNAHVVDHLIGTHNFLPTQLGAMICSKLVWRESVQVKQFFWFATNLCLHCAPAKCGRNNKDLALQANARRKKEEIIKTDT